MAKVRISLPRPGRHIVDLGAAACGTKTGGDSEKSDSRRFKALRNNVASISVYR